MEKKIVTLTITEGSYSSLVEKTIKKGLTISQGLTISLHKWYEANKETLNSENGNLSLKNINFRLDPEAEKLYVLFIQDVLNKLLDNLDYLEEPGKVNYEKIEEKIINPGFEGEEDYS